MSTSRILTANPGLELEVEEDALRNEDPPDQEEANSSSSNNELSSVQLDLSNTVVTVTPVPRRRYVKEYSLMKIEQKLPNLP